MEFRQQRGSDIWHWHTRCTELPRTNYIEDLLPRGGRFCLRCHKLDKMLYEANSSADTVDYEVEQTNMA